jgi:hypothetical protein
MRLDRFRKAPSYQGVSFHGKDSGVPFSRGDLSY